MQTLDNQPLVIGMTGQKQAGKDTYAGYLVKNHEFQRIALADAMRDAVYIMDPWIPVHVNDHIENVRLSVLVKRTGWDRAKEIAEVRRLLQVTGTEVGRELFGQNVWVDIARKKIEDAFDRGKNVVITDVRFQNEIRMVQELKGTIIRVDRPGLPDIDTHISEHDWRTIPADYAYMNDTTLEVMEARVGQVVSAIQAQRGLLG